MKEKIEVPRSAMVFGATGTVKGGKIRLKVSSGKAFSHPYWKRLALDLDGMLIPKTRLPILLSHDTTRPIGWFNREDVQVNGGVSIEGQLVDSEAARSFRALVKEGFPFEASLYGKPLEIERVGHGQETSVNGFAFEGEGSIWRSWELKEASPTVFGADSNTEAGIFSFANASERLSLDVDFLTDDDKWLAEMLRFASGPDPKKATLGDSEDDQAVKEMLRLARDPAGYA